VRSPVVLGIGVRIWGDLLQIGQILRTMDSPFVFNQQFLADDENWDSVYQSGGFGLPGAHEVNPCD
jgi:hypothetical protein